VLAVSAKVSRVLSGLWILYLIVFAQHYCKQKISKSIVLTALEEVERSGYSRIKKGKAMHSRYTRAAAAVLNE